MARGRWPSAPPCHLPRAHSARPTAPTGDSGHGYELTGSPRSWPRQTREPRGGERPAQRAATRRRAYAARKGLALSLKDIVTALINSHVSAIKCDYEGIDVGTNTDQPRTDQTYAIQKELRGKQHDQ